MMTPNKWAVMLFGAIGMMIGSFANNASAAIVAYQLTGTIDTITEFVDFYSGGGVIYNAPFGSFDVNDSFTITVIYDTSAAPAPGSTASYGEFYNSLVSVEFVLGGGGYTSTATSGQINLTNGAFDDYFELYDIPLAAHNGVDYIGSEPLLTAGYRSLVLLQDYQAGMIADATVMPEPISPIASWEGRSFSMDFGEVFLFVGGPFGQARIAQYQIRGTINAIEAVAIPEPSTLALAALSLTGVGVVVLRRRLRRA